MNPLDDPIHLLQVCNLGQILGGTAACAWTITRSLPGMQHTVAFLSPSTSETRRVFVPVPVLQWPALHPETVLELRPDVVLLHNTAARQLARRLPAPSLFYQHSIISPAPAHRRVCCSHWLAERLKLPAETVCWQPVPAPPEPEEIPPRQAELVIGRICTPTPRKWPRELVAFYRSLATRFPQVFWEFVGCPDALREPLRAACAGRAAFYPAGWEQRQRYWLWDAVLYHHPTLPESFGRIPAEAMRAGCVPILDRRGGFIEQVPPGGGFLCDSLAEFASAVGALQHPGQRENCSRLARAHAEEQFSEPAFAERFLDRLRELTGGER